MSEYNDENSITFKFSKTLYTKEALIKSAYSFTDRAYIHLDADIDNFIVCMSLKASNAIEFKEFENEMLAQMARHVVYEQTKDLRKLMVARAFASTIVGQSADTEIVNDDTHDVNDVLKNWFDE